MFVFIPSLNINMSEHYQKYRNTIRKVARRHRRLKDKWINEQLRDKSCKYCGESEIVVLKFYPDDRTIRSESQKISLKEENRKELIEKIENNEINPEELAQQADGFLKSIDLNPMLKSLQTQLNKK